MFDAPVAEQYDSFRALPEGVTVAIRDRVLQTAALTPGDRVLEVGAGTGRIARPFLQAGCRYTALDSSAQMLARIRPLASGERVLASATQLPFRAASFELVLAVQALGVMRGWRHALQECRRVLRPGGRLLIGRVERPPDSLHAFVREERARLLRERAIESGRPGAGEEEILATLSAFAAAAETLPPIGWESDQSPRAAVEANLSGWRILALPAAERAALRERLLATAAARWGDLEQPRREPLSFQIHSFQF